MYLLTNVLMISMQQALPASMFGVHECACVSKFHFGKWRPIPDQIFAVVETIFFHSV